MTEVKGLVSVVISFLDEERFLEEAIAGVFAQTCPDWELLLVDDGSTDGSTEIARSWAARQPERVHYLEHAGHANRGASASRNLGVARGRGEFIALLDGDDTWFADFLERSIAILRAQPEAQMVYGLTEYWHSWQGPLASGTDHVPAMLFPANRMVEPPELLVRNLSHSAAVACMGSLLIRRPAWVRIGGFEDAFRSVTDDQVFLAKLFLDTPVHVSTECWLRYRQHADSDSATAEAHGRLSDMHRAYLHWLEGYLRGRGEAEGAVWRALQNELRRQEVSRRHWRALTARIMRRVRAWRYPAPPIR
jgi:hypothetical protein